jgi:hypothetical protein
MKRLPYSIYEMLGVLPNEKKKCRIGSSINNMQAGKYSLSYSNQSTSFPNLHKYKNVVTKVFTQLVVSLHV